MSVVAAVRTETAWAIGSDTVWERGYLRGYRTSPKYRTVQTPDDRTFGRRGRAVGWAGSAAHERYVESLEGTESVREIADGWLAWMATHTSEADLSGNLLVAGPRGLYVIDTLGAVVESPESIAIGAGAEVAMGALATVRGTPVRRVRAAVQAAIRFAVGCGGEALILEG